ncbi:phage tail tip lysozyme [Mesorhizobium sp. M0955]|uniref:phage tail tip lysozyme n=1 Tax=Mesorhizobium sp. M0955 TaxID=2957033 RepID=UPI003338965A
MARLPSYLDLSGPENMRSGRAIATFDTSAIGRGLAAGAADISAIASQKAAEQKNQQNVVDIARAEAAKTEGLLAAQNQFDHDGDYATFGKRAPIATSEVVSKAGNVIRDPKMREKWLAQSGSDVARTNDSIFDWGQNKQRDAETNAFDDSLEANRRLYVDPNTPDAVRAKAKKDIEGSIQAGQAAGLLDPNAAAARRKTYLEDAEFSRGKLAVDKDPSIIAKPMPADVADRTSTAVGYFQSKGWTKEQAAGIVGNLMAESTLNTGARNGGDGSDGSDSIGIGQWNSDRARNLKAFAEQNHSDWRDFGTQLAFVQHELTHGESNAASLLKNAKDVKSATEAMIMYERPAGSNKGPQYAMAYKKRLQFAAQAAGQDVNPDWYKAISPEQRAVIDNEVDTRNNQLAVESRANIEVATTNGPAAMLNTGAYTGNTPSADDFFQAYGPQEGASRYNNFVASMQTNQQAYSMRTRSADDIQTMVTQAKPTSSGDDAALQTARYQTLSQAAETTLKAREADPASYVRQSFPTVNDQWNNAQNVGNYQSAVAASIAAQQQLGIKNIQSAVAASIAAQQQLGIKNIQPLPKEVATSAVDSFKNETVPQQDRISAVSAIIMATPDPTQRQALFNQMVEAGLPDLTQGAFKALSRGDEGAAQRLFQAAMIDPAKLAGAPKEGQKPIDIDEAVRDSLMDEGQIGDIYYGLSHGTVDGFTSAQRDSKLINNAVNLRLRNGETMDQAIAGVSKDLYGDVTPVNDTNMQILVPKDQDAAAVADGLAATLPDVKSAIEKTMAVPADANATDGTKAILAAGAQQKIADTLAQGFFRNSGDGYVFIDPKTSLAIADETGNPIIFKPKIAPPVAPEAPIDRNPPANVGIRDAVMGQ